MGLCSTDIPRLAEAIRPLITPLEFSTFAIKEDKDDTLNVYMNDRVYSIAFNRIEATRRSKSWGVLAPGVVQQLRSSSLMFPKYKICTYNPIEAPKLVNTILLEILSSAGLLHLAPPLTEKQDAVNQLNSQNRSIVKALVQELKSKEGAKSIDKLVIEHKAPSSSTKETKEEEDFLPL